MLREIPLDEFAHAHATGRFVLDIRPREDYEAGHLAGSLSIPADELADRLGELPEPGPLYVICVAGGRARQWATLLEGAGFEALSVEGGIDGWVERGLPLVVGPKAY